MSYDSRRFVRLPDGRLFPRVWGGSPETDPPAGDPPADDPAGDPPVGDPPADDPPADEPVSREEFEALQTRLAESESERNRLARTAAERDREEREAKRKRDEEAGNWQHIAAEAERERDAAKAEADRLRGQAEQADRERHVRSVADSLGMSEELTLAMVERKFAPDSPVWNDRSATDVALRNLLKTMPELRKAKGRRSSHPANGDTAPVLTREQVAAMSQDEINAAFEKGELNDVLKAAQ